MTHPTTIGIDPGSRTTAIITITNTNTPLSLSLITNPGDLLPPPAEYITDIITELNTHLKKHPNSLIAVESVTAPSWHLAHNHKHGSATNPTGLIGTAMILGAILAHHPTATLVPPNKNGSKPLGAYPPELVSPREQKHPNWRTKTGTGKLRHARSAYDVAITANTTPTTPL